MVDKFFYVRIIKIIDITHNVKRFVLEKPSKFQFFSGQATEISVDEDGWREQRRPFTMTSLPTDPFLEFTIKIYGQRRGVTWRLGNLSPGDRLILGEPWGAIQYKGRGVFIAGGAGITPFISIFRQLKKEGKLKGNTLLFSNKTEKDIILKAELDLMDDLEKRYFLTQEKKEGFSFCRIDEEVLREELEVQSERRVYICGPIRMVGEIQSMVRELGVDADSIVVET